MKLEKAIEILDNPPFYPSTPSDKAYAEAIKLGIEALKEVERLRRVETFDPTIALPGETED